MDIITKARRDHFARISQMFDWVRDVLVPHKQPFVYYDEYLASDYWQSFRREMLRLAGFKCQECGAKDRTLHVHHKTYKRLGREKKSDVVVLCESCHKLKHGIDFDNVT